MHAFATPLLTKADGTSSARPRAGRVWLDPELTSPYAFFQFWLNTDDARRRPLPQGALVPAPGGDRGAREGRRRAAAGARGAARAGRGAHRPGARRGRARRGRWRPARRCSAGASWPAWTPATLAAALAELPSAEVDVAGDGLAAGGGPVRRHRSGAEQERGPAGGRRGRRLPQQHPGDRRGGTASADDLLAGEWLVLRRGKRNLAAVRVRGQ